MKTPKFIFIVGGVISGLGKGIAAASLAKLLQARGYKVSNIKIDAYVNVDAGTMNPVEHGEVFVTKDGLETDQDIGNYERFTGRILSKINYATTGQIYKTVIDKERNLEYKGKCVEVVPHIPLEVIDRLKKVAKMDKADIVIVEIGGTVGEYQNVLFLEAGRMLRFENPKDVLFVLVSYLPIPSNLGEMKTKPTQTAVRTLNSAGIQPDFILARGAKTLDNPRKEKISFLCNMRPEDVVSAPDVNNIYEIPFNFQKENFDKHILAKLGLAQNKSDLTDWRELINKINSTKNGIKIAVVGKYFGTGKFTLSDSYISVIEAIKHASWANNVKPELEWVDSQKFENDPKSISILANYDAIVVPGGFGTRGVEGIIKAIEFARTNKIPYLGLCYGMQMAAIEFARHVCKLKNASSTKIDPKTKYPIIDLMSDQLKNLNKKIYGGTMRLGTYDCKLAKNTIAKSVYKKEMISERHRHRYEFNNKFKLILQKKGLIFSGTSPDGRLVEIIELSQKTHPYFIACQFHPEFQSTPLKPHPLFMGLIKAGKANPNYKF